MLASAMGFAAASRYLAAQFRTGGYCAAILSIARLYLLASRLSFLGLRAATTFGAGGFDVLNLSSPRLEFLLSAGVDGVNGVDVSGGLGATVARGPESLARG